MSSEIFVYAKNSYTNSAIIIISFHIIFLPLNVTIFFFTLLSKRLKLSTDVFNLIMFNVISTFFSRNFYVLFAYLWWYSYLTGYPVPLHVSNFIEDLRFIGMNMIFLTPFILSLWRYMIIYRNKNIPLFFYILLYIFLLIPNAFELYDSNLASKNLTDGDIFTKTYTLTNKYFFFSYTWPQLVCPLLTFFCILSISKMLKHQSSQNKLSSHIEKAKKNVTISLINSSILPMIASMISFILHMTFYLNLAKISRTSWNISEIFVSFVGGSSPILMVIFLTTFRLAVLDYINPSKITRIKLTNVNGRRNGLFLCRKKVVKIKNNKINLTID